MISDGDWASLLTHDWPSLLLQTLDDSPLLLRNTFAKRKLPSSSWQCHILACMFSCLVPRIRSEIIDWSFVCKDVEAAESASMETAMKETFHAIKQAENFVESCAGEAWRIKALACTGEALIVHIHDLFWCVSSLLIATRVSMGFAEDKLNAVMEQQVHCWTANIARYMLLGAELLDLREMLSVLDDERADCDGKDTEMDSNFGPKTEEFRAIVKLLTRRLKCVVFRESNEFEGSVRNLRIESKELNLEKRIPIAAGGYFVASWLGLRLVVVECSLSDFRQQAPTLLRMRNPFILQLIAWASDGDGEEASNAKCYMLMEAMETDLRSFMQGFLGSKSAGEAPFPFHVSLDMMLQIARGMWYLHRNGIAHGGLQSSNVLLESSKVPELAGEGYARVKLCGIGLHQLQPANSIAFFRDSDMEVSQDEDQKKEFAADVHRFGLLCIEILTGKHPLHGNNAPELIRPELPSAIPLLLSECLTSCCDDRTENRPQFGVICGIFRHLKLIVTSPHCLERVLNFFPEDETHAKHPKSNLFPCTAAPSDTDLRLQLININVHVLHFTTPTDIYPVVAAEAHAQTPPTLGLRALERMSTSLLEMMQHRKSDGDHKFIVTNTSTLKTSLVEGIPGLLRSWSSTALGMGTLEMWLQHLPTEWKLLHSIALGMALCLRYVSKTPPKIGFYSEEGIDGFYPIEPQNILFNCQFQAALLLDNSPPAWKRLVRWAGVHPQVGSGDNLLLSIEAYTTYYFGQLLSYIIKSHQSNVRACEPPQSSLDQHFEFVLTNLAMRCIELKYLSMTEVVTILLNECRPSTRLS